MDHSSSVAMESAASASTPVVTSQSELSEKPDQPNRKDKAMKVLAIDVGGTHVKILATGQKTPQKFVSGPKMTAKQMVSRVKKLAAGWNYEAVSIGYPGPVLHGRILHEPHNLAAGWVNFDFEKAFGCPVKVINDAAMQALGSYKGGSMLFLGLGTGLGSAMIVDGLLEPMELGHLPYRKATYEDYVGVRGLKRFGKKKWRTCVADVVERLVVALEPDDIVLGGGNVKQLQELPKGCREGDNANAFLGGFRLWMKTEKPARAPASPRSALEDPGRRGS
jgi:polyphosphate glucokinase